MLLCTLHTRYPLLRIHILAGNSCTRHSPVSFLLGTWHNTQCQWLHSQYHSRHGNHHLYRYIGSKDRHSDQRLADCVLLRKERSHYSRKMLQCPKLSQCRISNTRWLNQPMEQRCTFQQGSCRSHLCRLALSVRCTCPRHMAYSRWHCLVLLRCCICLSRTQCTQYLPLRHCRSLLHNRCTRFLRWFELTACRTCPQRTHGSTLFLNASLQRAW